MADVDAHTLMVSINGTDAVLAEPTIAAAMLHSGVALETRHVAVAVNEAVIPRAAWESTTLAVGDRIEIITAVAGG